MNPTDKAIDPNSIKLPPNMEVNEDEINGLVESIKEFGIQHRPAIKDNLDIISGKKRVLAAQRAGLDLIEVNVYPSDLSLEFYKSLSLHENLKRYNLPWYDQVVLEKELHELRQAANGVGQRGKKTGWSMRDTAFELNMALGSLSEDIRMADAVLADPSLKKVQDKMTARRLILSSIKRVNQEVSAALSNPTFDTNICYHGSSEEVLTAFPDCSFDACITDPPWLEFKDDGLIKDQFTDKVFEQVYRVLKRDSFLFAFVSTQDWYIYQKQFQKFGFNVQKWPLIWVKEGVLTHGNSSWHYQRDYEPIILAVKGAPALTAGMLSSVMSCKVVPSASLIHPNEKPLEIIKRLLEHCSFDNSLILDPFAGSGAVLMAARQMGRQFVGVERDAKFWVGIQERLKK